MENFIRADCRIDVFSSQYAEHNARSRNLRFVVTNLSWRTRLKRRYLKYIFRPHVAMQLLIQRWLGIPFSRWFVNFVFQRILRLNAEVPFQVHFTSIVVVGKGIIVGRNVWKSFASSGGCYIQGGNGIYIGDDTLFAPGVKIISANHNPEKYTEWLDTTPIRIGRRCWIGSNAVILPGVELGDDCIIGAGAVVTKSIKAGHVVVGNPATIRRIIVTKE